MTVGSEFVGFVSLDVALSFFSLADGFFGIGLLLILLQVHEELFIFDTGNFEFGFEVLQFFLHDSDLLFGLCDLIAPILIPLDLSIDIALSCRQKLFHRAQQFQVTRRCYIIVSSELVLVTVSQLYDTKLHVDTNVNQTFAQDFIVDAHVVLEMTVGCGNQGFLWPGQEPVDCCAVY